MFRWFTHVTTLLLILGWPLSGRGQGDAWGPPGGMVPAGWHGGPPAGQSLPPGYYAVPGSGVPGPFAIGKGRTVFEELPDDTGWLYEDSPLDRMLTNLFRHAYFRVEYLLWDVSDPGDNILGAPTNFVADPSQPFVITDPITGSLLDVVAPTLSDVKVNDNNGIRATFGFSVFEAGTLEASVFALQTSTSAKGTPTVFGLTTIDLDGDGTADTDVNGNTIFVSGNVIDGVAQSMLIDGVVPPGNNFFLLNDLDYHLSLKTQVWGAEGNWVVAPYDPGAPLLVTPLLGFRYFNFREDLRQSGVYSFQRLDANGIPQFDPVTGEPIIDPVQRKIDSTAINNLYGPQLGLRAELNNRWFSVGAQPKVMLGLNSYKVDLNTYQVLSPTDPPQNISQTDTTFGIVGDLEVYTRLHLTSHLSVFTSYNLLWAGLITRPADNVVYNIQRSPRQSNLALDPTFSGVMLHGLSVGGELRW
jgi:hypothetical protein